MPLKLALCQHSTNLRDSASRMGVESFKQGNTPMKQNTQFGLASSVMSFPERGPWGDSKWRGNASGHVYRSLFEQLQPKVFIDPMVGSGTSVEVAREMKIEAHGLDLHSGFDCYSMDILTAVGKQADLVISHPPYGGQIVYAGNVWGDAPNARDLSQCSDEEFHERMQAVMLNQRRATRDGGHYGTLIGDWRRAGQYTCYMAEVISRMPSKELKSVMIKMQHNVTSDRRSYGRMVYPKIQHEYLILFQKAAAPVVVVLADMVREQAARVKGTWKNIVRTVLHALGGKATLDKLYAAIAHAAPEKLATNEFWREKTRQTLQLHKDLFQSSERGVWSLAA